MDRKNAWPEALYNAFIKKEGIIMNNKIWRVQW